MSLLRSAASSDSRLGLLGAGNSNEIDLNELIGFHRSTGSISIRLPFARGWLNKSSMTIRESMLMLSILRQGLAASDQAQLKTSMSDSH